MRSILYLTHLGGLGGGESSLLAHILALDDTRFAPRVICGAPGAFIDELRAHNVPADMLPFGLPYFRHGFIPTATPSFFFRLYNYLRAHKICLIHCNDSESAYYAAPLAKWLRIPFVWTCWAWWQAERGWKSAFYERFFTRIVTPTEYLKRCLVQANPRLEERITVLPFGVDVQKFSPGAREVSVLDELKIPRDVPVITVLARFQSVKGHDVLLDAAPKILEAFPTARFLFVGDTAFDTQDANTTRRQIHQRVEADARLRAAVGFTGFRLDIPRVLRATDVLVCPSWFETYGMANLEAMACAVPVVSTNVGGPSETIVDGETGFLVPPHDPDAIAERICELLSNAALRRRMGERGRCRVEQRYDLKSSVAGLERIYEMLVG
ncbi:MAG TPA: glycosyltransferase family 4 protein [Anaerolineae bacterium]|nr:glycosyltransferase family 4 protein [Anaerolineae bacterium]